MDQAVPKILGGDKVGKVRTGLDLGNMRDKFSSFSGP